MADPNPLLRDAAEPGEPSSRAQPGHDRRSREAPLSPGGNGPVHHRPWALPADAILAICAYAGLILGGLWYWMG